LVFGLVLAETLLTVAVGLILGVILAYGASWAAAVVLGEYLGFAVPRAEFDAGLALRVVALLPLGLLAALPPALQAARQSPVAHL
jgi:putative ABC transport system permease protein